MKRTLIATIGVAAAIILGSAAHSEVETTKALISPSDIKWGPAPASLRRAPERRSIRGPNEGRRIRAACSDTQGLSDPSSTLTPRLRS